MALWPFGNNKSKKAEETPQHEQDATSDSVEQANPAAETPKQDVEFNAIAHNAVDGSSGPFDGNQVNIEEFNFTDFSIGILELGSLKIPLPKESQVQVEMGEQGPRMLHIVTRYGRITPVAFAAPRSSGQWKEFSKDLIKGVEADGLTTSVEQGPWGSEIVGTNNDGVVRLIGIEGPRWLLRFTLAGPHGMDEDLAKLGREVAARTFVYRGDEPILAGNSLPITIPQPLVEQIQQAMKQRQEQAQAQASQAGSDSAEDAAAAHMREIHEHNESESQDPGSSEEK